MTTAAAATHRRLLAGGGPARGSTILAIGLGLLMIVAGYGLKAVVETRTAQVGGAGVSALAPAGWRADSNAAELIVRHPGDPNTLYAASVVAGASGDLADVAARATLDRAGLLLGFQVTSQSRVTLGGRDGYQIRYTYVSQPGASRTPELIEAVDLYLAAGEQVLALSYEAPRDHFDEDYPGFERFAASAQVSQ